ncbi:RNA-guided endonuclease InsQ/TnpB family protein [Halobacteriaceae archaeon GCM10025711]
MEVQRTVKVKLDVPQDMESALFETVDQFLHCANRTSAWAWSDDPRDSNPVGVRSANEALYYPLREETDLHANLVQQGIKQAIGAVRSGITRRQKGQVTSQPTFESKSVVYDKRAATFHRDHVSLSTVEGRVECDYVLPSSKNTPHARYLLNEEYEFRTSTLHYRDGDWYLHATMQTTRSTPNSDTEHPTVLGVDFGVKHLAVASTGRFWSGSEFNHWQREYEQRRRSLQQRGTRWAHQNIQAVGRKESSRFGQLLHRVANEIVEEARSTDCSVIAIEDLTDIRTQLPQAAWHHIWAFRRLSEYITYKAKAHGITVEKVSPRKTSQQCSTCGHTVPGNRRSRDSFHCLECGYENHADYNAAKNIGFEYLRHHQTGDDGGAPAGVRLNSGLMTANGDYTPTTSPGGQSENSR